MAKEKPTISPEVLKKMEAYQEFIRFVQKAGLKQKEATCYNKRIIYFRSEQFAEVILNNKEKVTSLLNEYYSSPIETTDDVMKLLDSLLSQGVAIRFEKEESQMKLKYPKLLEICKDQKAILKGIYSWRLNTAAPSSKYYSILIIGGVAAIALFPVWPLTLKLWIFYISLYLLTFMLAIIAIRVVAFFILRLLGIEFWIFPNLFADVGVKESFVPFITCKRSQDGLAGYLFRLAGLLLTIFFVYRLYQEPEMIREYRDMGTESFFDVMEWGRLKLEGKSSDNATVPLKGKGKIPSLRDIIKEEVSNETVQEEDSASTGSNNAQAADDSDDI
eukprot:TRINITY_DN7369_c0_g1_i3.p1 TRINITY_DN7369_c0_g1~~TRINITY_DN7369_c0_g1_i3.p1  ORF type:complete len:331 (-),score=77.85 TRINITY_DN7369_c0_g1_i3:79-1071(-)